MLLRPFRAGRRALLHLEGILYQLAVDFALLAPDTHHVESGIPILQPVLAQKVLCGAPNLALFAPIDGFQGAAEAFLGACLDLDEDHRVPIEGDEIDFSRTAAVVAPQDDVALMAQVRFCLALPLRSEQLSFMRHLKTSLRACPAPPPRSMCTASCVRKVMHMSSAVLTGARIRPESRTGSRRLGLRLRVRRTWRAARRLKPMWPCVKRTACP